MGDAAILMRIAVEQVTKLLHQEAWFLDHKRWDDWLALYDRDAVYWAPALVGDEGWTDNPDNDVSLMYMDRAGLEARIFRIEGRDSYATDPLPHTAHLVTNVLIHDQTDDLTEVSATWMVHSYTRVRSAKVRGGLYDYLLRDTPDGLKIVRKKIFIHDDRIVGPIDIYNI